MTRPDKLLPPGVKDLFGAPARSLSRLGRTLSDLFERWAYEPILPPTFEYYDNIARGFDEDFSDEIYRFIDQKGHLLALRPDLTVPIARIVATKLYDERLPLRFHYAAPVFRYVEPRAGQQREFWQAGVELIGTDSPAADAEVLALHVAALDAAGLERFQVNLGHMGFLRGILADLDTPDNLPLIRRAIDRKNRRILAEELDAAGLEGTIRDALEALPTLSGGAEILQEASRLAPNGPAGAAIERLRKVYSQLEGYGVAERVTIDLGEVRGMDYYTGITFETFAPGSGYAIASGGRYDDLLDRYGASLPAVGFAVAIEHVLLVLQQEGLVSDDAHVDALMAHCGHAACLADLQARRARGEHIELDIRGRTVEELRSAAARRGIATVIVCGDVRSIGEDA